MDKIRLIHDFVDGQLDIEREEELFLHIAQDGELRREMKELIAMRNASSSIKSIFNPAPESTMKVFGTLGFTAPIGSIGTLPWYSRYAQGIKSGFASAFVVTLILFFAFKPIDQFNDVNTALNSVPIVSSQEIDNVDQGSFPSQLDNITSNISDPNSTYSTNVVVSNGTKTKLINNSNNNNNINKINPINPINNTNNREDYSESGILNGTTDYLSDNNLSFENILTLENSPLYFNDNYDYGIESEFRFNNEFNISQFEPENSSDNNFSLEVTGSKQNHFSDPEIAPETLSPLNNYNISLMYDIDENFSIGVGFRQETFNNTFEGIDELGVRYRYDAQPNYSTFGLLFRYYPDGFTSLRPFGEFMIGANSVGMTNTASIGLNYEIFNNLALVGSVELSNMTYNYQGSLFNSSKYGFRYGLQFNM